jgi:hypothetical protein
MPPFFKFTEIILHNFRNTPLEIHKNSKIGILSIKSFSKNTTFLPQRVENAHFMSMQNAYQDNKNSLVRFDLSDKICKMLTECSPLFKQQKQNEASEPFTLQAKQIKITSLVKQAWINVNLLKLNKNGTVKMDFYRMQNNLNQILLGQYVMKSGLHLSKADLREIQISDPTFLKLFQIWKQAI